MFDQYLTMQQNMDARSAHSYDTRCVYKSFIGPTKSNPTKTTDNFIHLLTNVYLATGTMHVIMVVVMVTYSVMLIARKFHLSFYQWA